MKQKTKLPVMFSGRINDKHLTRFDSGMCGKSLSILSLFMLYLFNISNACTGPNGISGASAPTAISGMTNLCTGGSTGYVAFADVLTLCNTDTSQTIHYEWMIDGTLYPSMVGTLVIPPSIGTLTVWDTISIAKLASIHLSNGSHTFKIVYSQSSATCGGATVTSGSLSFNITNLLSAPSGFSILTPPGRDSFCFESMPYPILRASNGISGTGLIAGITTAWWETVNFPSRMNNNGAGALLPNVDTIRISSNSNDTFFLMEVNSSGCGSIATKNVYVYPLPYPQITGITSLCKGSKTFLNVTDTLSTGTDIFAWTPSATLSCANCSNPTANPVATTTYSVKDSNTLHGCNSIFSATITVTVSGNSVISANGSGTFCNGGSKTLSATSSGGVATYSWAQPAGGGLSLLTGTPVTAIPSATGIYVYTVTGTVTSGGCMGQTTDTLTVNPIPTISAGPGIGICQGSSATLTATGGTTYSWTPATGLSSTTAVSPTATPTTTTTYTVTGTSLSCSNTAKVTVTVNALPVSYTLTGGGSYCIGGTGVATGLSNSTSGISYQLYAGGVIKGSPVIGTGAAISFGLQTTAGTYTVIATNTATGCKANMAGSVVVVINPLPTAYIVTGGGDYCIGGTGELVGLSSSTTGVNYQLQLGGLNKGSLVAGTGTAIGFGLQATAGTYTIAATNATTGCTANMTGSVVVNINPLPTAYIVTGGGSYCLGGTGVAVGLSSSASGVNYQLFTGALSTGSPVAGTGAAISFGLQTIAGTYTVIATNTATGCTANMTGNVTVNINPLPTAYVLTGGGGYCAGGTGTAIGLSNSAPGINYQLLLNGSGTGSPVAGTGAPISFGLQTAAGTYTVVATNAVTGCTANMTGSVIVSNNPLPTVYNVTGGGSYCTGGTGVAIVLSGSSLGVNYQLWAGGSTAGIPIAGTGSAISFGLWTTAGTYTVIATNTTTGCTANMAGSVAVTINSLPTVYTVTGGGSYCAGGTGIPIGLTSSAAGINYQLQLGSLNIGSPLAGTGAAISFGLQTSAGTYTIVASNATTGCTANMTGSVAVIINPLPMAYTVNGGGSYCIGGPGKQIGLNSSDIGVNYQLKLVGLNIGSPVAGTGYAIGFGIQTAPGIYTVTAINTVTGCTANMTGSVVISINSLPASYTVTGGGSYCTGGPGIAVGLGGSDIGVNYQLWAGGLTAGIPIAGTGAPISFGLKTTAGIYTVVATNTTTGCTANMTGSVTVSINLLPAVYTVTGGGSNCSGGTGIPVGLTSSDIGVIYQLQSGGLSTGALVTGTGVSISFGLQTAAGTYTVVATNTATGCTANMAGNAVVSINSLPTVYTVTGGGIYCTGGTGMATGLSSSTPGINYQLQLNGSGTGSPVAGTGAPISFGLQTAAGTYTVVATNVATGCTANMTGSVTVSINLLPAVYSVTGGGRNCSDGTGIPVGLTSSDIGINYQLQSGGLNTGGPIIGTGVSISFGLQTAAGTYTVVATNTATGCTANMAGNAVVSINPLPTVYIVTGGGSYCADGTGVAIGLSSSVIGVNYQLWADATNTGVQVAGTGTAISFGLQTTGGNYSVVAINTTTGCTSNMTGSASVSINSLPAAGIVTGGGSYCAGGTGVAVGLSSSEAGVNYQLWAGVTTSGSPVAGTGAPINFGLQTAAGIYTIVGTNATTGCSANMTGNVTLTINVLPAIISVNASPNPICVGSLLTLSATGVTGTPAYNWSGPNSFSSANISPSFTATTTAASGIYSLTVTDNLTGCTSIMAATPIVTVNPIPDAITGITTITGPVALADAIQGGTWSSSNTSIAIVGPLSGIVTGVTGGTATITYALNTGCYVTTTVNVIAIGGKRIICGGSTDTLTYPTAGGTWTSASPSVATVGSTSGVVTGLSNGTSLISYTFNGGTVTAIVTVDVLTLTPITGPGGLCMDSTAGFSNNTPGGVWRSGSPIATIDNYGVVSGVSMGYVNISYTFTDLNSCSISVTKTINVTGHPLYLYTDAGNGTGTSLGDGGPAANATIGAPRAMCADTAGNVYICDVTANRVRKLDIYGFMTTVAGNGKTGNPVNGMAATATSLSMSGGGGVYVDNTGNIYISNTTGQTVSKVTASTGIISTICGTGIAGYSGDGGLASAAKVQTPLGICGDSSGNLYFADASNERIRKIDTKGIITTIIGTGSDAYSGDGGPGTSARVSVPRDLAMDIFGNMYIADFGNYVVRKYVMATGIISTFAGNGLIGVTGDGGPATAATMNTPARLAYDGGNMLYIADQNNNKVRGVNLTTGIINTVVATGKSGFGGDGGPSVLGQLYSIGGIAFNRLGNLYMSDINNKRIRVSPYNGSILITQSGPTSVEVGTSVTFTAHASLVTDISFQWQLGGIDIQGATSSTYTVNIPTSGSYSCILTVFPDCGDVFTSASNNLVINAYGFHNYHTGFIDPQISEGVQVYPNPVHGTLKISGSGIADGDVKISVYDLMGRSILSKSGLVTNGNLEEQVDMQSLAGGVYLISVIDYSGKTRVFKCVKD